MFAKEYRDLADLLLNNGRAQNYYKGLPDNIQQAISHNSSEIRTMRSLRHFAKAAQRTGR
ncbi:hypothetical protein CLNEO_13790 [Anaerotignum neopropionicum]|uniref:Uncharacterized protein n=1 Tax=Anaerotignum neopropionicum TaxID=36847 RepID=A0A136WFT2_9FIRM|nr:hypothetical protein [Anaerotignum neopropionicum]KXL53408.1 hypothetical protein CLNEO_13790 [Anaerotignum neopropionicum]